MKDFLQGRATLANARTKIASTDAPSHFPPISQNALSDPLSNSVDQDLSLDPSGSIHCGQEPQIDLVHDSEGRIAHIIVTCRCGDQVTLQCNY